MGVISVNLSVGDPAPAMALSPSTHQPQQGPVFDGRSAVGKPVVMFFYLSDESAECVREIQSFRDLYPRFQELGVVVVGVGVDPAASHQRLALQHKVPFPLLSDPNAHLSLAYGAAHATVDGAEANVSLGRRTVLVDANRRIAKIYEDIDVAHHAADVLCDARQTCFPEEPRRMVQHAPVLLIPNVLAPDMCRHLIEVWETQGNEDSGFMRQVNGKTVGTYDYDHKIRRDHFLRDGALRNRVKSQVADRVIPEIFKAFNYEVTRFEDFRIACYDGARGGYFRPHRDNTTDGTAHRRFAMSLLLNDEYEGGTLRFPEYGPHFYRPHAGCAVVFSCSLLHEATDVTNGRRFVLLSFFYGEKEAKLREEYNRRTGGEYRSAFTSPVAPPSTAGEQAHAGAS
jgi:peroxiredoxin/predicted 2-oxoglutarate/Fe(II)-dependent dioxygenase YbiX